MHSSLTLILFVIALLLLLLFNYKLRDFLHMQRRVYDLVSFTRMGNPSQEDISHSLKQSSGMKFSTLGLSFALFLLRRQGKITTSVLRVTIGTQVSLITTYAPTPELVGTEISFRCSKHETSAT